MANLVRRIRDREPTLFRRFDPFRSVWDLMRWDLFRDLMRWDPFGEVPRFERPWGTSYLLEMEVKETPDAFVIHADVPGVEEKDIDVSIAGNVLTVSGKREEEARDEGDQYVSHERSYGSFCRSFTLPEGSDAENVVIYLFVHHGAEWLPDDLFRIGTGSGSARDPPVCR
ncbi:Hsp20/alpha crystallin family protein [Sorangium sp. So ce1504]|uniref:Hsp20/alpha crystallin family protein n=1 Tax=Sorangium sp. So ce1504 TaxID=3133337 RepID=UPI003F63402A